MFYSASSLSDGGALLFVESPMTTAKLFKTGRSQAVRLPKAFRFDGDEVNIRRNEETGEVILTPRLQSWDDVFVLLDAAIPADFLNESELRGMRQGPLPTDLFGDNDS
jgi:antitoxin VapB